MLPPIPYNGAMRPTLMVVGMAALFLLLQRTRRKPCYGRLLWAASAIYLLFLLYATLLSRTAGEEYSYRIEPLVTFRRAFAVEGGLAVADPQMLEGIAVNLLLMAAVGYLLPQLFKFTAIQTVLLGARLSLSVELIQLVTRLGMFELDDIILQHVERGAGPCAAGLRGEARGQAAARMRRQSQPISTEERNGTWRPKGTRSIRRSNRSAKPSEFGELFNPARRSRWGM